MRLSSRESGSAGPSRPWASSRRWLIGRLFNRFLNTQVRGLLQCPRLSWLSIAEFISSRSMADRRDGRSWGRRLWFSGRSVETKLRGIACPETWFYFSASGHFLRNLKGYGWSSSYFGFNCAQSRALCVSALFRPAPWSRDGASGHVRTRRGVGVPSAVAPHTCVPLQEHGRVFLCKTEAIKIYEQEEAVNVHDCWQDQTVLGFPQRKKKPKQSLISIPYKELGARWDCITVLCYQRTGDTHCNPE